MKGFYFDDQKWAVRYVAVDTGSWLSARLVLGLIGRGLAGLEGTRRGVERRSFGLTCTAAGLLQRPLASLARSLAGFLRKIEYTDNACQETI